MELRKQINSLGQKRSSREEVKTVDFSKPAGKLTAPTRITGSSMDNFLRY
jgi:hypothetical protein